MAENAERVICKLANSHKVVDNPRSQFSGTDVHGVRPALCSPCGSRTIKNVQGIERSRDLTSCGVHDMKTAKTMVLYALTIWSLTNGCVRVVVGETQDQ